MNNTVGECLYDFSDIPPCIQFTVKKYPYLIDFLNDISKQDRRLMISHKIDCIEFKHNHIDIRNENCINCMFCVFSCPGSKIEIRSDWSLKSMCSNFKIDYKDRIGIEIINNFFNGQFLQLPSIRTSQFKIKYKSFSDFTEKDETENISVWGANTLKFLSIESNPRLGLEVGMKIQSRDRGGRLDICLLSGNNLFVAEAKVSFDKMISEGRYIAQMIAYEEEITQTLKGFELNHYKFLLIGGKESDLLPQSNANCTAKVGNRSQKFYETLVQHNLFFISTNALLTLGLLKLFKGDDYSIDRIFSKIFTNTSYGLISSGLIVKEGNQFIIKPLL